MWEAKTYDSNYFDDIVQMSLENFGPDNDVCDREFARYQYFRNPAGDALIELAIDPENGTVAGQYVIQPQRFYCFGEEIRCALSLNTLTREAYRGKKIFTGLAERTYDRASDEGYVFIYGAPNQNSYHGFTAKLSFKEVHCFPLYARPLNLSRMADERTGNKIIAAIAKPFNVLFPSRGADAAGIVELSVENCGRMDRFWERIKGKYPIMGIRDAKYIRYRYLDVPRRTYYPYVALQDGEIVAFAVGRIREVAGFETGMIADFLFLPGHEELAGRVIKVLVKRMKDEGASLTGCIMLAHTEEARILKKCGFYHIPDRILPQPTPLILRILDKTRNEEKYMDVNNWFFTTGDYDVV